MLNTLLLILLLGLGAFAVVNVVYALFMVGVMLLRMLVNGVAIPLLHFLYRLISLPLFVLGWVLRGGQPVEPPAGGNVELGIACRTGGCGCDNPPVARYCRRCGRGLQFA